MKIAVVYRPPAVSSDQYLASWANGSPMPDPTGLLFHAGVGEGDDFFTISIWENQEAYEAFASRFESALGEQGFEGGAPKILPVHHTIGHGGALASPRSPRAPPPEVRRPVAPRCHGIPAASALPRPQGLVVAVVFTDVATTETVRHQVRWYGTLRVAAFVAIAEGSAPASPPSPTKVFAAVGLAVLVLVSVATLGGLVGIRIVRLHEQARRNMKARASGRRAEQDPTPGVAREQNGQHRRGQEGRRGAPERLGGVATNLVTRREKQHLGDHGNGDEGRHRPPLATPRGSATPNVTISIVVMPYTDV